MKQHNSLSSASVWNPSALDHQDRSTGRLLFHLTVLLLIGLAFIFINPRGYIGGAYDDGRYLAAATRWAMDGPVLGQDHWSLRWPLVLPAAAIIRLAGLDFNALMIPGILSYLGLALVNYIGLRSVASARAGFLGALGILATPGIAYWSCALYPDLMEAALWSAAFWSLWHATHATGARQTRWVVATGFIAGLSFCVRETSAGLAIGLVLAMLFLPRLPLRLWIVAGASAAILPVAEYAILWAASGDPLYRLHVDLNHIAIASEDMRGGVAKGELAVFNTGIMERWAGAGPVHVHWAVDTWINFFLNFYYGQNYVAAAVLGICHARTRRPTAPRERRAAGLVPALLAIGLANTLWNLYVLALNPSDRMFIPMTVMVAMVAAVLADRLWPLRGVRRFVGVVMGIKILSTLIVADTLPNYHHSADVARRIAPPAGAVHVSWQTHANLALADPALRRRLDLRPAPAGGVLLLYTNLRSPLTEHLSPGRWILVRRQATGHYPYVIAVADMLIGAMGQPPIKHADIDVRLFRRLPGPPLDHAVVVGPDGRNLPADTA
ncbi:MAG: glycosyltransferase family 39 protein, partial [Sphingobium sp.]